MAFSNTLFAGLSGLDTNETRLNIVANNIANSNTVGFKATRALFKPQFYVTDSSGSQPTTDNGGTNPSQRGLGVTVASLEKNFNQGSIETTGKTTDLALNGNGFFIVKSDETKYTRDGSFELDANNNLVTGAGDFVQGYSVDANYNLVTTGLTKLAIPLGTATTAQATSKASFEGNLDASGSLATGSSVLLGTSWTSASGAPTDATLLTDLQNADGSSPFSAGDTLTFSGRKGDQNLTSTTFNVTATSTVADLSAFMQNSLGINTAVQASSSTVPTPGVTLEADATNASYAHLVIAGNAGAGNQIALDPGCIKKQDGTLPIAFATGTNTAGQADNPVGESIHTGFTAYDSLGTPLQMDVTITKESQDSNGTTWRFYVNSSDNITATGVVPAVATGTLPFGTDGKLRASTGTQVALNRFGTGAATPLSTNLDFSQMTSFASQTSDLSMSAQDGSPVGQLSSFSVGGDGRITGVFSNGISRTIGQVAVATFVNPQGLVDRGGNMYVEAANSGAAVIGTPGGLGVATVVSGALELSNVDLSEEFTNMIIASTGYSASSRVISTASQLMTDLLNSSR
ncbi:MAG: flagellar hook-basal body complex protein [Tepidisphaeraceae bacterium]|jgi:flagellar hook protein FlgE